MRARAFAVGLLNGKIQPQPHAQGSIPAIPLPVLQKMIDTNTWLEELSNYIY